MKRILVDIHTHIRESRSQGGPTVPGNVLNTKHYDRFPLISLPPPAPIDASLGDVLVRRKSREVSSTPLTLARISALFGHSMANRMGHRPYPSGGALYPVEAYLLPFSVEGLQKKSYHYRPDIHALEELFPIENTQSSDVLTTQDAYPLVIVFSALWARSHGKYHDFALELALMEVGHIMQNVQLVATAVNVAACPMGGFRDENISSLLDLDTSRESVLCALAAGHS